jgi:hypothetical protein
MSDVFIEQCLKIQKEEFNEQSFQTGGKEMFIKFGVYSFRNECPGCTDEEIGVLIGEFYDGCDPFGQQALVVDAFRSEINRRENMCQ